MNESENARVAVLYIGFKEYGLTPFKAFLESYRSKSAGLTHTLNIALKGFADLGDARQYIDEISDLDCTSFVVNNTGYDIGTYYDFARNSSYSYYCFLNSKSLILDNNWLGKIYDYAQLPDVGMVGATGSFESLLTDYLQQRKEAGKLWWPWREMVRNSWFNELRHRLYFPSFPNIHLRTNAFMIRKEVFLNLRHRPIINRIDAARFESGRHSVSRQIKSMKLNVLVVGRDGNAYNSDNWAESGTFWQGNQTNLLVADNQTEKYDTSIEAQRRLLSRKAWGR